MGATHLPTMLALACSCLVVAASASVASAGATTDELLPDLRPVPPHQLVVDSGGDGFHLGFDSNAENIGDAELRMRGSRPNTSTPQMEADQLVRLQNGSQRVYEDAGVFEFVTDKTHRHWHWQRFVRYELRHASNWKLGNRDVKAGFCVADRKRVDGYDTPAGFPDPTWCEQENPGATKLVVGLSVGWGDPYDALLEGQSIEVTDLRAGNYYLVHHANPARLIRETNYANNLSAALIELSWPNGKNSPPRVDELVNCRTTGTAKRDTLVDEDGGGNPTICALKGNDIIRLLGEGRGRALGGPGNDTLISALGGSTLDGGSGRDTASYARLGVEVEIDLDNRLAQGLGGIDVLVSIENATGGNGDDVLHGSRKRNVLVGGPGHDSLRAGAGDDLVRGGTGRDTINGGTGQDRLIGGPGNDNIVSRDRTRDTVSCGSGSDTVMADASDRIAADCEDVQLA